MSEVNSLIELNDSDIIKLESVVYELRKKQEQYVHLEAFRREVIERFGEAGFEVKVEVYTTDVDMTVAWDISIVDRIEGEFDPEKMAWETTHDVLGLGEGGVIKSEGQGLILPKGHKH